MNTKITTEILPSKTHVFATVNAGDFTVFFSLVRGQIKTDKVHAPNRSFIPAPWRKACLSAAKASFEAFIAGLGESWMAEHILACELDDATAALGFSDTQVEEVLAAMAA